MVVARGGRHYDVIIVGTGIAGSVLAYNLEKSNVDYLICTEQKNELFNTSALSYGHCRIPDNIDETIEKTISLCDDNEERLRFVYSNSNYVYDLFEEIGIKYSERSFGILPSGNIRGGKIILRKLHDKISRVSLSSKLIDFSKNSDGFAVTLNMNGGEEIVYSGRLILATGGYGGMFKFTDNYRYEIYNVFDIVQRNGGNIINKDSLFMHPFGYSNGRRILVGDELASGEFVDENGNFVFGDKIRTLIKNNDYHEIFDQILDQESRYKSIYFVNNGNIRKIVRTCHYTSGGIETDHHGNVIGCKNLYAIGECSADGSKNGGRLPGYPMTSSIVLGREIARKIVNYKYP